MMPRVYAGATTVAVSESTVREMRRQLGWAGPIQVIHNGVDPPAVTPDPATEERRSPRICTLGRQVPHKRVELVVRAFAQVRQQRPDVVLDVVGAGPSGPSILAEVRRQALSDSVTLHGQVTDAEKSRLLGAARLHVCASDAEGWGVVVSEAAAHGVPTLGRDVPGIRDSVVDGETGWLLGEEPGGGDLSIGLARAMVAALGELDDPGRRTDYARACRSRAGGFTWARTRAEAVRVAADLLRARSSQR
jgi:glycosyltransferase involved in cell wall biosynthesis